MIKLFSGTEFIKYPKRTINGYINLKAAMDRVSDIYTEYYNRYEGKVDNADILVRLLKYVDLEPGLTKVGVLNRIDAYLPSVLRHFLIISHLSTGSKQYNLINSNLYDDYFSINPDNYKTVSSLKVIETADLTAGLYLKHYESIPETDIVLIDVKALLLSYYYWKTERALYGYSIDPSIFLFQIPYTNMSFSRFDYSLYRVILNKYLDSSYCIPAFKRFTPIAIPSYSSYLNTYIIGMVREYRRVRNSASLKVLTTRLLLPYSGTLSDYLYNDYGFVNSSNEKPLYSITVERMLDIAKIIGVKKFVNRDTDVRELLSGIYRKFYSNQAPVVSPILNEKIKKEIKQLKKALH